MARCAVVQNSDNIVVNIIIADASVDLAPDGCKLIDIDNFPMAGVGWIYDPVMNDFTPPPEEPVQPSAEV